MHSASKAAVVYCYDYAGHLCDLQTVSERFGYGLIFCYVAVVSAYLSTWVFLGG